MEMINTASPPAIGVIAVRISACATVCHRFHPWVNDPRRIRIARCVGVHTVTTMRTLFRKLLDVMTSTNQNFVFTSPLFIRRTRGVDRASDHDSFFVQFLFFFFFSFLLISFSVFHSPASTSR